MSSALPLWKLKSLVFLLCGLGAIRGSLRYYTERSTRFPTTFHFCRYGHRDCIHDNGRVDRLWLMVIECLPSLMEFGALGMARIVYKGMRWRLHFLHREIDCFFDNGAWARLRILPVW